VIAKKGVFLEFRVVENFSAEEDPRFAGRGREPSQSRDQGVVHPVRLIQWNNLPIVKKEEMLYKIF